MSWDPLNECSIDCKTSHNRLPLFPGLRDQLACQCCFLGSLWNGFVQVVWECSSPFFKTTMGFYLQPGSFATRLAGMCQPVRKLP
eukprot:1157940-Pelagomonas_calceolata.AAC.10